MKALSEMDGLVFIVASTNMPLTGRETVVAPGDQLGLAHVTLERLWLVLAFPDFEAAQAKYPDASVVGIPLDDAVAMCLADSAVDGLVIDAVAGDDAWAVVTREALSTLGR
jgi:hypothetical protein